MENIESYGELNEKHPGGIEKRGQYLEEGFKIIQKNKKYFVADYIDKLWYIDK